MNFKLLNYCWFVFNVTSAVFSDQEQERFSPLRTKYHFHINSLKNLSIVLTTNMTALSLGCQPNIAFKMWFPYPLALFTNFHF